MVGGGEGGQGHFVIAGGVTEGFALAAEGVRRFGADGPIDKPGLAEPAAADAAPHDFQYRPVVDGFGIGDDEGFGVKDLVHVLDDAFCHLFRRSVLGGN